MSNYTKNKIKQKLFDKLVESNPDMYYEDLIKLVEIEIAYKLK